MHTNASNGRAGRHLRKVGQLSRVPGAGSADEERTTLGCMSCMWAGTFLSCGALGQQAGAAAGAHLLVDQVCPEARALLLVRAPVPAQRLVSWLNVRLQNGKGGQAARPQERLWVRGCGCGWCTGPCPAGVAGGSAHPPRTSGGSLSGPRLRHLAPAPGPVLWRVHLRRQLDQRRGQVVVVCSGG